MHGWVGGENTEAGHWCVINTNTGPVGADIVGVVGSLGKESLSSGGEAQEAGPERTGKR